MLNKNQKKNIWLDQSKTNLYVNEQRKLKVRYNDLDKSKKVILKKFNINNKKVLDIGCAAGGKYIPLSEKFNFDYTGIDIDKKCILHAKSRFKNKAKFFNYDIFDKRLKKNSFDIVMIWDLFYMFPNWKEVLIRASEISKEYIMFDNKIKYEGNTIIDKDISYQYYHRSNKRNHYIVHNLHELLSFFQINELNLDSVFGYGYKMPGLTSARLPLSTKKVIIGSFVLHKSKKKIVRTGVRKESKNESWTKFDINFPGFKK
jgi:2-polyprenyl-3-methyl-5-hydroxy-6-metoxy-1,4-benzoquinol methylase